MAGSNAPALQSNDVDRYDLLTISYRQRLATAMSRLRNERYYSSFWSIPAAPSADPEPASDSSYVRELGSNRVFHYDLLTASHRTKTSTEVTRYNSELNAYVSYYNQHHDTPYSRDQSQILPLNVVDDQAANRLASNVVDAYDVFTSSYGGISSSSTTTTGTRTGTYTSNLNSAVNRLDALKSGNNSISSVFQALSDLWNRKFSRDQANVTPRANMSVVEAVKADFAGMGSAWTATMTNFNTNTLIPFKNGIIQAVEAMQTAVRNGCKDVGTINAALAKSYNRQGYTNAQIANMMHLTTAQVASLINS